MLTILNRDTGLGLCHTVDLYLCYPLYHARDDHDRTHDLHDPCRLSHTAALSTRHHNYRNRHSSLVAHVPAVITGAGKEDAEVGVVHKKDNHHWEVVAEVTMRSFPAMKASRGTYAVVEHDLVERLSLAVVAVGPALV